MQLIGLLVGSFVSLALGAAQAQAQAQELTCDATYIVKSGDTLSALSQRAYGRATAYQRIFDYNPGVLANPNTVPVGARLYIPCEGGGPIQEAVELEPIRESRSGNVKILTGSEYPPYVDSSLPEGGFSFELVRRAMQADDSSTDYRIDAINDWGAHLSPLLEDGAYDLGFPWFQPDCSQIAKLGEHSRWRCNNLHFSEPLHEVVVTFFARAEEAPEIRKPEDVFGLRVCRPRGYFTHDLEVMDLAPPTIVRNSPDDPTACFQMLMNNETDVVTINADTSDRVITELGIRDQVEEVIALASVQRLHVVGMKTNPQTRVNLLRLNKGLISLRGDGTFRQLAAKHLSE